MDTNLIGKEFIIWLKDGKFIKAEQTDGKAMTVAEATEFAKLVLSDHGINPDQFDHVSNPQELEDKTQAFLFGCVCAAGFMAFVAWLIFG